jgi:hypothetical protein
MVGGRIHKTQFRNDRVHARRSIPKMFVNTAHDEQLVAYSLERSQECIYVFAEWKKKIQLVPSL